MAHQFPAWMKENLGALKAAGHMSSIGDTCRALADQLDVLLLDVDGADEFTDLVSELESVADYAAALSEKLLQDISK